MDRGPKPGFPRLFPALPEPDFRTEDKEVVVLVLSRKRNEKIVIGDEVVVTILEVRGDQVQLGIEAPRRIPVHRFEVYEAIRKVTEEAAQSPPDALDGLRNLGRDEADPTPADEDPKRDD